MSQVLTLESGPGSKFDERVLRDVEEVKLTKFTVVIKLKDGSTIIARPSYFDEIAECRDLSMFWFYDCIEENLRMEYEYR